jgi:hypothetical protein
VDVTEEESELISTGRGALGGWIVGFKLYTVVEYICTTPLTSGIGSESESSGGSSLTIHCQVAIQNWSLALQPFLGTLLLPTQYELRSSPLHQPSLTCSTSRLGLTGISLG